MKKNLLLMGSVFASLLCIAQPILTSSNTNMLVGEINTIISYNWVAPGNSGANQTWNFGAITTVTPANNSGYTVTTVPASVTAQYPNAHVILNTIYGGYVYKTSSASLELHGFYDAMNPNNSLAYQNPLDLLHYPFTFSSSFTDTYSGTQGPSGVQQFSKGTATITADGYGTLTLPNGTFSNVLRVYAQTVGKDSSSAFQQSNFIRDEYWWFLPNNHFPILQNSTVNYGGGSIYQDLIMLQTISTGISEISSVIKSFNLYPNPNSGKILNLDLNLTENAKYEITIVDNLGREVFKTPADDVFEGYNLKTIDVSGLENGIYNLGIILEGGKTLNRKITIQK